MANQTSVTKFILLGLSSNRQMQIFLFLVILVIYLFTLVANLLMMSVIRVDSHLQTPMYFFLFHLSFVDMCYSSVTVPKMLIDFLAENKTISVHGCIAQMFFILLSGGAEVFILSAMVYDRYAAICAPLHYMKTMRKGICVQLVGGAWAMGLLDALFTTAFALKLHFCGPNEISHFSCEPPLVLQLSCTETLTSKIVLLALAVIFGLSSFLFTLVSYIHVIFTILRIHSVEGRHKAFSTCSSHLTIVGLLYMTAFFQYTKPSSVSSVVLEEMFSIQYSILTPMLNPIIYSLKNKEVKKALKKMLQKFRFLK